jgi:ribosomal protein S18 acetylase RimI-like enzyme
MNSANTNKFNIVQINSKNEIIRLLRDFDCVFEPSISSRIKDLDNYADKLQKNALVYAAKDDNNIGFVAFYANDEDSKTAYLIFIGVLPAAQKRGVGKNMLKICKDTAKQNGMSYLKLEVRSNNFHAIDFYKSDGFRFCGEASADSIYMTKKL